MKHKAIPCAIALFFLTIFACKEKSPSSPCSGLLVSPAIVPSTPYFDPAWHPSGSIIGFNHLPLEEIKYAYGKDCPFASKYIWKPDSLGFWLIDADGRNQRRVLPFYLYEPSWSPDGKWIAFMKDAQIFKMPFDGVQFDTSAMVKLTFEGRNFFPSWSPDGKWIVYDSSEDSPTGLNFIWKMKENGEGRRRIVFTPGEGEARMPGWGSNNRIVFQKYIGIGSPELFSIDTAGKDLVRITTNNSNEEQYPKYSFDAKYIAFAWQGTGVSEMHGVNADGTGRRQLTKATGSNNFSWGPDGRIVYLNFKYSWTDEDKGSLWIMNADGSNPKPLTFNNYKISE